MNIEATIETCEISSLIVNLIIRGEPLTIITKCSILDVAAVLDPPLIITQR